MYCSYKNIFKHYFKQSNNFHKGFIILCFKHFIQIKSKFLCIHLGAAWNLLDLLCNKQPISSKLREVYIFVHHLLH